MKAIKKMTVLAAASAMAVTMAAPAMAVTFTGSGPGTYSASTAGDVATFDFAYNGYGRGVNNAQWTFETVADRTGTYTFQYDVNGYSAFYNAYANASAFSGADNHTLYSGGTYDSYNRNGTFTLDLIQGQAYGIHVGGGNFDSDSRVQGTFKLTSDAISAVPEPASWAMMIFGVGAVGGALRRRQKTVTRIAFAA